MPEYKKYYRFWVAGGLPVVLFGLTYFLLGYYYETNDDQLISFLLRGITIKPALSDLSIYFHGWSWVLVRLYNWLPAVPWYGILLYLGLLVATVLAFSLVQRPMTRPLRHKQVLLVLVLFYVSSWLEHVMWFNYTRVPLLLAGIAFLVLVQQTTYKNSRSIYLFYLLTGFLFIAALCVRPSAALLGLGLVAPAGILLRQNPGLGFKNLVPFIFFGAVAMVFMLLLRLNQTSAVKEYQTLDWYKSTVIDFEIYQFRPTSYADSLAFEAVKNWFLADTKIINERFYRQAGNLDFFYILEIVAPQKLGLLGKILLRDQFLVIFINGILLFFLFSQQTGSTAFSRRVLIFYQIYFWSIIMLTGIFLKLPPRLITPALSLYTLVHLVLFWREMAAGNIHFKLPKVVWLVLALLLALQVYKISHRANLQKKQKQTHETFITEVKSAFKDKILVSAVFQDYLRSLSPFRNYDFGSNTVFLLTGWSTLDPGYKNYYTNLSGQPDFAATVWALAHNPNTIWLLPTNFEFFMQNYYNIFYSRKLLLKPWLHPIEGKYPVKIFVAPQYKIPYTK